MFYERYPILPALMLLLFAILGCAKSVTYNENVHGTVKLDGIPLANVRVEFIPVTDAGLQAPNSSGMTDEKGQFQLTCDNQKPGAVIAKHRVIVLQGRDSDDAPKAAGKSKHPPIPQAYTIASQTPLKLEITQDQTIYDLNLKRIP